LRGGERSVAKLGGGAPKIMKQKSMKKSEEKAIQYEYNNAGNMFHREDWQLWKGLEKACFDKDVFWAVYYAHTLSTRRINRLMDAMGQTAIIK